MYLLITITEIFLRSWQVLNLWGIPFKVHSNWVVLFFLFSWSVSSQVNEIYTIKESWLIGIFTAFLFLSAIIINQIIHTFICIKQGMKIKEITFYFLGAILQTEKDCHNAVGNIKISLVRPLFYFFSFIALAFIISLIDANDQIFINILNRLSNLILFLGLFNLLPVGSLDGGILLKSIIWYCSGSKTKGRMSSNKVTFVLSSLVFLIGLFFIFNFSFYFGILLFFLGLFGINSARAESQFLKIEKILIDSKVSSIKLKPLRRIEFDLTFSDFNNIARQNSDKNDKYYFITNNGRWQGFITEDNLKDVSMKKWKSTIVNKFNRPINEFPAKNEETPLWRIIEEIEKTNEGMLLITNSCGIPKGLIDRNQIGYFVLKELGFNFSTEILKKIKNKNDYPLGIELPRIIEIMKIKGDIK